MIVAITLVGGGRSVGQGLVDEPGAGEQLSALARAQRLASRSLFRQAATILKAEIERATDEEVDPSLTVELADVYSLSGIHREAARWSTRVVTRLDGRPDASDEQRATRVRAGMIAARSLAEIGEDARSDRQVAALKAINARSPNDSLDERVQTLRLRSLNAELRVRRGEIDPGQGWRLVSGAVDAVRNGARGAGAGASAERLRASRALVDAYSRFGRHAAAGDELRQLLRLYPAERAPATRIDLLSQLAGQKRLAGESLGRLAALSEALQLATETLPPADADSIEQVDVLLMASDLSRRMATVQTALDRAAAGRHAAAAEQLAGRALRSVEALPELDAGDRASRRLLARKRRLEAAQALQRIGDPASSEKMTRLLAELLDSLQNAILPDDVRLALVQSALGAEHLLAGRFDDAEAVLVAALGALRRSTRPVDLSRAALMLSEVRQSQGRLTEAAASLAEARGALRAARAQKRDRVREGRGRGPEREGVVVVGDAGRELIDTEDLNEAALAPWIEVNSGRIASATGRYTTALARFDSAEQMCRVVGPRADGALAAALIHRGAVYRTLARFDDAQQACADAIALREKTLAPTDRRLLPYRFAMAGVAAARRDAATLRREVDAARAILDQNGDAAAIPAALLHFDALAHLLDDAQKSDAAARDAARRLWGEALALQTEQGRLPDQARSRHYLSRVALRDAMIRREQLVQRAGSEYDTRRRDLEARMKDHEGRCAELEAEQSAYRDWLDAYDQMGPRKQSAEYPKLLAQRKELGERVEALAARGAGLEQERAALEALADAGRIEGADQQTAERLLGAEAEARQACELLARIEVYPRLHYAALCNYAEVLRERSGGDADARRLAAEKLSEAIKLVEAPRLAVGDEAAQSEFFARHSDAFDLLVHWNAEDGRPLEALVYADLGRNRTFLDQIRSCQRAGAAAAPEASRPAPSPAHAEYAALSARLRELFSRDTATLTAAQRDEQRLMSQRLHELRLEVEIEEAAASDPGRELFAEALTPEAVRGVIGRVAAGGAPTICYYVGARHSYLFLVGLEPGKVEAVPLLSRAKGDRAAIAPAGRGAIERIVHDYLDVYRSSGNARRLVRGGRVAERLAAATEVILPTAVRQRLRRLRREGQPRVTIAPDGPLFQLPFAALVTSASAPLAYLMDEAPPLIVSPSLMVGDALARPRASAAAGRRLLSVARPAYFSREQLDAAGLDTAAARYRSMGGAASDLPYSEAESNAVCGLFGPGESAQLLGGSATESSLRGALERDRPAVLHLATHGVASNGSGAIEGALALAAPTGRPDQTTRDDGFLELSEIAELPLTGCSLAVLSACQTNLGRDRPLEMGASFARAFLAAGARRVAATHWQMDDESGAQFVRAFFEQMGPAAGDPSVDYARSMHAARAAVRQTPEWDTPYHWAVFGLIGPVQ